MEGGGVRRGNVTTIQTRGLGCQPGAWEGRDEWPESSVDTASGSLMARYGATAPRRQWTAQWLLNGRDGVMAPRR